MLSIWVFCLCLGEGWVVCEGVQLGELTRSQKTGISQSWPQGLPS